MLSICESQENCDFIDFFLNGGVPETPWASGLIGVRNLRDVELVCCFFLKLLTIRLIKTLAV